MHIVRKDAAIANTGGDDAFPGTFDVILSAPTEDRDGDILKPEEWKQPLPNHITFDADHGMSVASTVGSGVPSIDPDTGNLVVSGSYSSLPRAQEVRTLVNEGHVRTVSVAFMPVPSTEKGKKSIQRELLNGAFVAVPSNREALVLASKSVKAGARNSAADAATIQSIHDATMLLGADCTGNKSVRQHSAKAVAGSLEATQFRITDALNDAYGENAWVWLRATFPADGGGMCVFEIDSNDGSDSDCYQQSYTDDGSVVTLTGDRKPVDLMETIRPDPDEDASAGSAAASDAAAKAASSDAAADEAAEIDIRAARIRAHQRLANLPGRG